MITDNAKLDHVVEVVSLNLKVCIASTMLALGKDLFYKLFVHQVVHKI